MASHDLLMEAAYDLAAALAAAPDEQAALQRTAEIAMNAVQASGATIFLHDPEARELHFAHAIGRRADSPAAVRMLGLAGESVGEAEGIVGAAFQGWKGLFVNDVTQDPRHAARIDEELGFRTASAAAVPLARLDGTVFGVLQVLNRRCDEFAEEDLATLGVLAQMLALALAIRRGCGSLA